MTHIRSALVAALLTFGATAVVSAQSATPAPQAARAQHQRGPGHRRGDQALLNGLTLSAAEKANVESVRAKYAPQIKALREQFKPQAQAMRDARQRGDTAAVNAMWQKNSAQREQAKQLMQAERAELRAALSPENQAKFDANLQNVKARRPHGERKAAKRAGATVGF